MAWAPPLRRAHRAAPPGDARPLERPVGLLLTVFITLCHFLPARVQRPCPGRLHRPPQHTAQGTAPVWEEGYARLVPYTVRYTQLLQQRAGRKRDGSASAANLVEERDLKVWQKLIPCGEGLC